MINTQDICDILEEGYMDCTIIIYLNVKQIIENAGTYTITQEEYKNIEKKLKQLNMQIIEQFVYQYNDMELIIKDNNHTYLSKKYLLQKISNSMIINIINIKEIDKYKFPIVNKYHNEYVQNIQKYKIGNVEINLVNEMDKYYMYISFTYNNKNKKEIMKDIETLNNYLR